MKNYNDKNITLDDIVFEGRNQDFGAYVIRKKYDRNVIVAVAIGCALVSLALASPAIYKLFKPAEQEVVMEKITPVELKNLPPPPIDPKTPPPPPMPSTPPPPKVSTIKFVPPEVAPDEEVVEEPPKQEELKNKVAGTETAEGDPNADPNALVVEPGEPGGTGIVEPQEEEIFTVVEQMPLFPGGMEEMMAFMSKNTKYPYAAQRAEVQGTVYIQFVVGTDGKIRDVSVIRGIGFGCDEEAKRVVGMMPAWNPGKQGGRPVTVRYTLPFKFTLRQ